MTSYNLMREFLMSPTPKLFSYHKPAGAYYAFPKILNFKMSSFDFAKKLVDEAKVITIPSCSMEPMGENHLRIAADTKWLG